MSETKIGIALVLAGIGGSFGAAFLVGGWDGLKGMLAFVMFVAAFLTFIIGVITLAERNQW